MEALALDNLEKTLYYPVEDLHRFKNDVPEGNQHTRKDEKYVEHCISHAKSVRFFLLIAQIHFLKTTLVLLWIVKVLEWLGDAGARVLS